MELIIKLKKHIDIIVLLVGITPLFLLIVFRLGELKIIWFLAVLFSVGTLIYFLLNIFFSKYKFTLHALLKFVLLLCIFTLTSSYPRIIIGYTYSDVSSASNNPTIIKGDMVFDDYWISLRTIKAGQMVGFVHDGKPLRKRIHGMPGDQVCGSQDDIFINGYSYFLEKGKWKIKKLINEVVCENSFKLKPWQYYVLGDNPSISWDSRSFGPIDKEDIISILSLRVRGESTTKGEKINFPFALQKNKF